VQFSVSISHPTLDLHVLFLHVFFQVAQVILAVISSENLHPQVHASCLLCMAEFCSVLGPHMIPLLPSLVPCVLQHVGEMEASQVLLQISATTALSAAVQTLPKFLGTHINDIVLRVSAGLGYTRF